MDDRIYLDINTGEELQPQEEIDYQEAWRQRQAAHTAQESHDAAVRQAAIDSLKAPRESESVLQTAHDEAGQRTGNLKPSTRVYYGGTETTIETLVTLGVLQVDGNGNYKEVAQPGKSEATEAEETEPAQSPLTTDDVDNLHTFASYGVEPVDLIADYMSHEGVLDVSRVPSNLGDLAADGQIAAEQMVHKLDTATGNLAVAVGIPESEIADLRAFALGPARSLTQEAIIQHLHGGRSLEETFGAVIQRYQNQRGK